MRTLHHLRLSQWMLMLLIITSQNSQASNLVDVYTTSLILEGELSSAEMQAVISNMLENYNPLYKPHSENACDNS